MSYPLYDRVPVAVVGKYIRRWLDEYLSSHMDESGRLGGYVATSEHHEGKLEVLAFQSRTSGRKLRTILNAKVDEVDFDTADRIVCATAGPMAWHTEEDLIPYYGPLQVTAKEIRLGFELPEGFDFDALSTAKKYQWSNAQMREAA